MENEGIIEPVEVCVCGDYRGTVNSAIQAEQFPILMLDEIWQKSIYLEEVHQN